MSDWQDKSDFEVNKAVAILSCVAVCDEQYLGLHDRDENVVLCVDDLGFSDSVDYCNEPSDAWPIIIQNEISIIKTEDYECWSAFEWGNDENEQWHKNPLRAAMIVYLEMNGVKP